MPVLKIDEDDDDLSFIEVCKIDQYNKSVCW